MTAVARRLRHRNKRECPPAHIDFYASHERLRKKTLFLDNRREELRHKLAILEHETAESARGGTAEAYQRAATNALLRLAELQSLLGGYNDHSSMRDSNMSKIVFDQRKLIQHQMEEMRVVKEELSRSIDKCATMESQLHDEREHTAALEAELSRLRAYAAEKEEENALLREEKSNMIERIVAEKLKTAAELDEMNKIVAGEL